jgi:chemosensory pili system protein ChpA (sensor histidine kinase/response regulator)
MADPGDEQGEGTEPLEEWNAEEAELLRGLFLGEADVHLRHIGDAQQALLRAWEQTPEANTEAIDTLFRHLHTLKGAAGSVGYGAIGQAAHDLEELCADIRSGSLAPTPGILERVDEGVAGLRALLDGARAAPSRTRAASTSSEPLPDRRRNERRATFDRRQGSERTVRVASDRLDELQDGVGDLVILRTRIERRLRELEGVMRDLNSTRGSLRHVLGALGTEAPARVLAEEREGPSRLGGLLDRLGEVEVEFTDAIAYLERATKALGSETESLRRTGDHLEEQVRRARRVSLEWVFGRLGSALRELEPTAGRRAELVVHGGEIELDKGVVEQIGDPLLHLLRNAMAHGIEPEEERVARGKPPQGRIEVTARQEGEFVYLQFEDDGRGIDRDSIREALVRTGKLAPEAPLDEPTLLAAIFQPGFSSRENSDALAGRGMGLNIVKQAVVRLGGDVSVEYRPGMTRFRLSVPLTAAITQALLFKVGGQVYAVPAAHVVEALPIGLDDLLSQSRESAAAVLGPGVPVLRLQSLLGVETPPGRRGAALRIQYGERSFVATCDKIIGPRTIVVRPLGPLVGQLPLYAGVTISGAGKAQLVLDLAALADAAHAPAKHPHPPLRRGQPRVLVVDDSRLSREAAARVLAAAGYHPVTAEDGWEAWEMIGERRFDAVVTDLEMPRLDGFELIGRIRRDPTLRGLPVIVLSSRTSQATRERAVRAGADVVLPKVPNKRGLADALAALVTDAPDRPRAASDV